MPSESGEFAFIEWLRRLTPPNPRVLLGPGDDAAVIHFAEPTNCLITTDMLMDGTCFHLADAGPRLVGRKAMAVNLSDMAAMAGKPLAAVVSVALPRPRGRALAEELYAGLLELAKAYETAVVGGDTSSWDGPLVVSVTLLGEATARGTVGRAGARIGDRLLVTGTLGGSILGKHLHFTPRVREAMELQAAADIHAMIDISDGLAADTYRLCKESGCGARLHATAVPIAHAAELIQDEKSPLDHALGDGEDFELVFAVDPSDAERMLHDQPVSGIKLVCFGECVADGLWLEQNGCTTKLEPHGYVHELE